MLPEPAYHNDPAWYPIVLLPHAVSNGAIYGRQDTLTAIEELLQTDTNSDLRPRPVALHRTGGVSKTQ